MTGNLSLLSDVIDIPPSAVIFPDGNTSRAVKSGKLTLSRDYYLSDVLYIPDFTCTLIFMSRLLKQTGCVAIFTDTLCVFQDRFTRTRIGTGEERDGVYYFTGVSAARVHRTDSTKTSKSELWHRRLGHPSFRILSALPVLDNLCSDHASSCEICFRAKQSRGVFRESSNKASEIFSLIHCDVWGPYRTLSSCGAAYFLTVVDDCNRVVWTYLMLEKSEVAALLKQFFAHTERQFGKKVKTIRTDNGTEFMVLSSFFREQGIEHQTSCVYTPQQNGRVERKHRHILNIARACLFQARLPVSFWGESILTAAHLINYTPTKVLDGKSPYEVLFGVKPAYDQLRVFGCLCFAHRHSRDKDKFSDHSRRCIFVGYPYGKKALLLYDLETNEFFSSRDVIFSEDVFPGVDDYTYVSPPLNTYDASIEDWLLPSTLVVSVEAPASPPNEPSTTTNLQHAADDQASPGLPELLGKGRRLKTPSVLLKDYISHSTRLDNKPTHVLASTRLGSPQTFSGNILYPIANYVSDSHFSASHQAFVAAVSSSNPPKSYLEAVRNESWREAMTKEIDALDVNNTWDITSLPPGKKAIGTMWIYTNKFRSDGTLERHKARLVALGNNQEAGEDFTETFAPVAKLTTVWFLLRIATGKNWMVDQMDVHNAFLHGDLEEEVYMKLPQGFSCSDKTKVCRLKKSLYGLRQAPRCWYSKLSTALRRYGFSQKYSDYSLF